MVIRFHAVVFLLLIGALAADEEETHRISAQEGFKPWFTGPLIAPSANTLRAGRVNIQPYLFFTADTGIFTSDWHVENQPNFYHLNFRLPVKVGICDACDFQLTPQMHYKHTQGVGTSTLGDLPIVLNFQWLDAKTTDPWPSIKLGLGVNIPSGKYQQLSANRLQTDIGGSGNWAPGPILTLGQLLHIYGTHYLEWRLSSSYRFGIPVGVKGINTYGGVSSTRGTVYPGNVLLVDGAIQYNLDQRWAFACDLIYQHTDKNRFCGQAGDLDEESIGSVSSLSVEQFSIAPAIEYNLNENLGFLFGVWGALAGRNATQFISGVLSFNARI
ncbi:MAG: hypothetical protein WCF19_07940 [Chlamydiales bacterium]